MRSNREKNKQMNHDYEYGLRYPEQKFFNDCAVIDEIRVNCRCVCVLSCLHKTAAETAFIHFHLWGDTEMTLATGIEDGGL